MSSQLANDEINAITGATVTSNAVTGAVNYAIDYFSSELGSEVADNEGERCIAEWNYKENPTFDWSWECVPPWLLLQQQ